jgi:two-component system, NtrC family, sensor histidine kinase HydH
MPPPADSPQSQYAELAELAGGFIHEFKNHLSTLGLNLQLLAEDFGTAETHRERRALERVQRLQHECDRLVEVSNDFLRFARLRDLDLQSTCVRSVIEEMVDFVAPTAKQANVTLTTYLPADLPHVALDADLFKQALLNLMLNAEQAMPQGGELIIQACVDNGGVRLDLIDTGLGMTTEQTQLIFRPFFTTKPGGNGLGLATTKRIVEAHGGTIAVESEPGRGTKFTVRLSAAAVSSATA